MQARWGPLRVSKLPGPDDARHNLAAEPLADGARVRTEGATLRAVHTPGHALDHLCFVLEEEGALFSGDNVLGVGTTVIPSDGGDLLDYMDSLARMLALGPRRHLSRARAADRRRRRRKLREYIAHRNEREAQILAALGRGGATVRRS